MTTIKSYTDIEQSKELAKILPIKSADMYYPWYIEDDGDAIESGHRISIPNVGNFMTHKVNKMILPCWSLAALLGVLNKSAYFANEAGIVELSSIKGTKWCVSILNCGKIENCYADNPVDACCEMIIKLHELNLL